MMNSIVLLIATLYLKVCDGNQMDSSTFDPNQFKMAQREGWDSVAAGFDLFRIGTDSKIAELWQQFNVGS